MERRDLDFSIKMLYYQSFKGSCYTDKMVSQLSNLHNENAFRKFVLYYLVVTCTDR